MSEAWRAIGICLGIPVAVTGAGLLASLIDEPFVLGAAVVVAFWLGAVFENRGWLLAARDDRRDEGRGA